MITVSLIALAMVLINGVLLALGTIDNAFNALPPVDNALSWLTTSLTYLSGIFNISVLADCIIFLLSFTAGMIMWKLFFIIIGWIPIIGSYIKDPLGMINDEITRHSSNSSPVNEPYDDFAERHGFYSNETKRPYTKNIDASRWYR